VFAKALAVAVSDRYEHMAAFWNALGAALEVRDFVQVSADAPPGMNVADERPAMSLLGRMGAPPMAGQSLVREPSAAIPVPRRARWRRPRRAGRTAAAGRGARRARRRGRGGWPG
jgi:hypothetical protein